MTTECETNCATFEIIQGQHVSVRVADSKVICTATRSTPASRVWTCDNCGKLAPPSVRPLIERAYEDAARRSEP